MPPRKPFLLYCKENQVFIWLALIVGIVYFILLRWLYPVPSYFADSFTYIGAAAYNQQVSFRPLMYSKLMQFFHLFTYSDIALIAAQYFSTLLANLFLFLSTSWLFQFKRWQKILLFSLLIVHPFYLFSTNYISSDAFFNSFTILWFTLLLWIMYKPTWYFVLLHVLLLLMLFMLRYNAIYFPIITAVALFFTDIKWWKKAIIMILICAFIISFIEYTSSETKRAVGTKIFTAFSGWQFANNALHIVRFEQIDTTGIEDKKVKQLLAYNQHYFIASKDEIPVRATAWYMWHPNSPLKKYMKVHNPKARYFNNWNSLAPLFEKFGKEIILQNPAAYVEHFVLPNSKEYFLPRREIFDTYFEDVDTVAAVATKYFHYKTNKVSRHKPVVYAIAFTGWNWLFLLLNVSLVVGGGIYLITKQYSYYPKLLNHFLLCFFMFAAANFSFIVLLAPSVLRYHISILTIALPVVIFLGAASIRSFVSFNRSS